MKKFLQFLYLNLCFFCPLLVNAAGIFKGPYVEDIAPTTAIVKFTANEATPAWLEYGPIGKCSQLMAISASKRSHKFVLHGLIPNTQFCYKAYVMNNDGTGVQDSVDGTFRTLFTPERKIVNFFVIGNTAAPVEGDSYEIKERMAQSMSLYDADFIIHTGNISSEGTASSETKEFFEPYSPTLRTSAFLAVAGSDEYGPNANTNDGKNFFSTNYKINHNMPWSRGTPNYFYIDTANARIIFVDVNNLYGALSAPKIKEKTTQYEWLQGALARTPSMKWKIVVLHYPVYSSGATEDLTSPLLAPLFEGYKVNLVIQGHQGAYERTTPIRHGAPAKNGPVYITVGGSGKFFEDSTYNNEWSSKYIATPHFAHIKIIDRKLSLRVYTHDNKMIDALDINF